MTTGDGRDRPGASYDGHWSRLTCSVCESVFEVEGDVDNGEVVTCEVCGDEREVEGR